MKMPDIPHNELLECAGIALRQCLKLDTKEHLLVVCDGPCFEIGQAFFEAGRQSCAETVMVQITPRAQSGNEPPTPVGEWFGQFEVAVMPTSKSLTHTQARRKACEKGARIATLPGITADMFLRTMRTDWDLLSAKTRRVALALSAARMVEIKSAAGTNLTFDTGGRPAKPDDGKIDTRGSYGNLPAGEAYLAPLEGSANGTLVFDGSFPIAGILNEPLRLYVEHGEIVSASGHTCTHDLEKIFETYGRASRNIAEFGVGTLDTARIGGHVLEDEKVEGTIHIAIGDNASMGGTVKVPVHLDGIVRSPSVWLDGKLWMQEGKLVAGDS
jgi:leucyl aminopeptidase (aminopeptidase T)